MKFTITKEQNYKTKRDRKIYIEIESFKFTLTQDIYLKYILSFLLAYKNFTLNSNSSEVLVNSASSLYDFEIFHNNKDKVIILRSETFSFSIEIDDFLAIVKRFERELDEIVDFHGFSRKDFDIIFLHSCAEKLLNVKKIIIEEICFNDLRGRVHSKFGYDESIQHIVPLNDVPAYKYLVGDKDAFLNYKQYNYLTINNKTRLDKALKSIKKNGYPLENKYIILFDDNSIRDGLHRAAILAYLYGFDKKMPVMRILFNNEVGIYSKNKNLNFSKSFNNLEHQVMNIKKKYRQIAIYGYGKIGRYIAGLLDDVVVIGDIHSNKIESKQVCHPEELKKYKFDCIIISVFGREQQITDYLHDLFGFDTDIIIITI
ncbi:MAG: hypothetical protein RBR93_08420 [Aliarcobacter butzleri]|nr:hypothetical protein [Aliarcobacter butzleri]